MFQPRRRLVTLGFPIGRPRIYSIVAIEELLGLLTVHHARSSTHCEAVGILAGKLAAAVGLDEQDVQLAQIVGILHDIGKIAVPAEILDETMTDMHVSAFRDTLAYASVYVLEHEESLQPFAPLIEGVFTREETELEVVQIVRLCDAFDAMSRWQPYRTGIAIPDALQLLKEEGRHCDEHLDALAAIAGDKKYEICLS